MHRGRLPLYLRVTAAILLAAFVAQDAAWATDGWAASAAAGPNPQSLRIAPSAGRIESSSPGRGPLIVHIRDAHANPGAQKNVAEILRTLKKEYGVKTVFLEGGTRDDSLGYLVSRAPLETRKQVANKYVLSGELSGAELLSVTTDPELKLLGVEDRALYERNLRRYADVKRSREKTLADLSKIQQRTESLKRRLYPKPVLEFDEAFRAFRSREASFSDTFDRIQEAIRFSHLNPLGYPNLLGLARLKELEARVDFPRAQKELARLLSKNTDGLKPALPALEKLKRGSPAELQFFESVLRGAPAKENAALTAYADYLRAFSSIDLEKLFAETESFEDQFFDAVLDSAQARQLHAIGRHLERLEDLFRMQISREDFERLEADAKDIRFRTVSILAFLNRLFVDAGRFEDVLGYTSDMDRAREPAEAFYRENDLRDEAMVRKTLEAMQKSGEKVAALVSGGYHTENLKRLLAARGVSYAVVSPNVEVETNHDKYEKTLLESLSVPFSSIPRLRLAEMPAALGRFESEMAVPAAARLAGNAPRAPSLRELTISLVNALRLSDSPERTMVRLLTEMERSSPDIELMNAVAGAITLYISDRPALHKKVLQLVLRRIANFEPGPVRAIYSLWAASMIERNGEFQALFAQHLGRLAFIRESRRLESEAPVWTFPDTEETRDLADFRELLSSRAELRKFVYSLGFFRSRLNLSTTAAPGLLFDREGVEKGGTPIELAGRGEVMKFRYNEFIEIIPASESFRRAILLVRGRSGAVHALEVKFPGQDDERTDILPIHYDFSLKAQAVPELRPNVLKTLGMVEMHGIFDLHHFRRVYDQNTGPLRLVFFDYRDGKRLAKLGPGNHTLALNREYLARVAQAKGFGSFDDFARDIAIQLIRTAKRILDLGYAPRRDNMTDFHLENFKLLTDGTIVFVNDVGAFEEKNLSEEQKKAEIHALAAPWTGQFGLDFESLWNLAAARLADAKERLTGPVRAAMEAGDYDQALRLAANLDLMARAWEETQKRSYSSLSSLSFVDSDEIWRRIEADTDLSRQDLRTALTNERVRAIGAWANVQALEAERRRGPVWSARVIGEPGTVQIFGVGEEPLSVISSQYAAGGTADRLPAHRLVQSVAFSLLSDAEKSGVRNLFHAGPGPTANEVLALLNVFPNLEHLYVVDAEYANLEGIKQTLDAMPGIPRDRIKLFNLRLDRLPFPDGFFDAAFSDGVYDESLFWDVFGPDHEHALRLVSELKRVLKPGGYFVSDNATDNYLTGNGFTKRPDEFLSRAGVWDRAAEPAGARLASDPKADSGRRHIQERLKAGDPVTWAWVEFLSDPERAALKESYSGHTRPKRKTHSNPHILGNSLRRLGVLIGLRANAPLKRISRVFIEPSKFPQFQKIGVLNVGDLVRRADQLKKDGFLTRREHQKIEFAGRLLSADPLTAETIRSVAVQWRTEFGRTRMNSSEPVALAAGEGLLVKREALGFTQEEFARLLDPTKTVEWYKKIEANDRPVSRNVLLKAKEVYEEYSRKQLEAILDDYGRAVESHGPSPVGRMHALLVDSSKNRMIPPSVLLREKRFHQEFLAHELWVIRTLMKRSQAQFGKLLRPDHPLHGTYVATMESTGILIPSWVPAQARQLWRAFVSEGARLAGFIRNSALSAVRVLAIGFFGTALTANIPRQTLASRPRPLIDRDPLSFRRAQIFSVPGILAPGDRVLIRLNGDAKLFLAPKGEKPKTFRMRVTGTDIWTGRFLVDAGNLTLPDQPGLYTLWMLPESSKELLGNVRLEITFPEGITGRVVLSKKSPGARLAEEKKGRAGRIKRTIKNAAGEAVDAATGMPGSRYVLTGLGLLAGIAVVRAGASLLRFFSDTREPADYRRFTGRIPQRLTDLKTGLDSGVPAHVASVKISFVVNKKRHSEILYYPDEESIWENFGQTAPAAVLDKLADIDAMPLRGPKRYQWDLKLVTAGPRGVDRQLRVTISVSSGARLAAELDQPAAQDNPATDSVDWAEKWLEPYRARMTARAGGLAKSMGLSSDAGEDAVQEAFLKAWKNRHAFRGESSWSTYLYRILTNEVRDALRKFRARPQGHADSESVSPEGETLSLETVDPGATPEEQLITLDEARKFRAVLERLPPNHRRVLELWMDAYGMNYEEIRAQLAVAEGKEEINESTFKVRLFRAKLAARRLLLRKYGPSRTKPRQSLKPRTGGILNQALQKHVLDLLLTRGLENRFNVSDLTADAKTFLPAAKDSSRYVVVQSVVRYWFTNSLAEVAAKEGRKVYYRLLPELLNRPFGARLAAEPLPLLDYLKRPNARNLLSAHLDDWARWHGTTSYAPALSEQRSSPIGFVAVDESGFIEGVLAGAPDSTRAFGSFGHNIYLLTSEKREVQARLLRAFAISSQTRYENYVVSAEQSYGGEILQKIIDSWGFNDWGKIRTNDLIQETRRYLEETVVAHAKLRAALKSAVGQIVYKGAQTDFSAVLDILAPNGKSFNFGRIQELGEVVERSSLDPRDLVVVESVRGGLGLAFADDPEIVEPRKIYRIAKASDLKRQTSTSAARLAQVRSTEPEPEISADDSEELNYLLIHWAQLAGNGQFKTLSGVLEEILSRREFGLDDERLFLIGDAVLGQLSARDGQVLKIREDRRFPKPRIISIPFSAGGLQEAVSLGEMVSGALSQLADISGPDNAAELLLALAYMVNDESDRVSRPAPVREALLRYIAGVSVEGLPAAPAVKRRPTHSHGNFLEAPKRERSRHTWKGPKDPAENGARLAGEVSPKMTLQEEREKRAEAETLAREKRYKEAEEILWGILESMTVRTVEDYEDILIALDKALHAQGLDTRRVEAAQLAVARINVIYTRDEFDVKVVKYQTTAFAYLRMMMAMRDQSLWPEALHFAQEGLLSLARIRSLRTSGTEKGPKGVTQGQFVATLDPAWHQYYHRLQSGAGQALMSVFEPNGQSSVPEAEERLNLALAAIPKVGREVPSEAQRTQALAGQVKLLRAAEEPASARKLTRQARALAEKLADAADQETELLRAMLAEADGDGEGALKAYEKAWTADPSNALASERYARALLNGNHPDKAREVLLNAAPDRIIGRPLGMYLKGRVWMMSGQYQKALEAWAGLMESRYDDYLRRSSDFVGFHKDLFTAQRKVHDSRAEANLVRAAASQPFARGALVEAAVREMDTEGLRRFGEAAAREDAGKAAEIMGTLRGVLNENPAWSTADEAFRKATAARVVLRAEAAWSALLYSAAAGAETKPKPRAKVADKDWNKFFSDIWSKLSPDEHLEFLLLHATEALDHPAVSKNSTMVRRITDETIVAGADSAFLEEFLEIGQSWLSDPHRADALRRGSAPRPFEDVTQWVARLEESLGNARESVWARETAEIESAILSDQPAKLEEAKRKVSAALGRTLPADWRVRFEKFSERITAVEGAIREAEQKAFAQLEADEREEIAALDKAARGLSAWNLASYLNQTYRVRGLELRPTALTLAQALKAGTLSAERAAQIIRELPANSNERAEFLNKKLNPSGARLAQWDDTADDLARMLGELEANGWKDFELHFEDVYSPKKYFSTEALAADHLSRGDGVWIHLHGDDDANGEKRLRKIARHEIPLKARISKWKEDGIEISDFWLEAGDRHELILISLNELIASGRVDPSVGEKLRSMSAAFLEKQPVFDAIQKHLEEKRPILYEIVESRDRAGRAMRQIWDRGIFNAEQWFDGDYYLSNRYEKVDDFHHALEYDRATGLIAERPLDASVFEIPMYPGIQLAGEKISASGKTSGIYRFAWIVDGNRENLFFEIGAPSLEKAFEKAIRNAGPHFLLLPDFRDAAVRGRFSKFASAARLAVRKSPVEDKGAVPESAKKMRKTLMERSSNSKSLTEQQKRDLYRLAQASNEESQIESLHESFNALQGAYNLGIGLRTKRSTFNRFVSGEVPVEFTTGKFTEITAQAGGLMEELHAISFARLVSNKEEKDKVKKITRALLNLKQSGSTGARLAETQDSSTSPALRAGFARNDVYPAIARALNPKAPVFVPVAFGARMSPVTMLTLTPGAQGIAVQAQILSPSMIWSGDFSQARIVHSGVVQGPGRAKIASAPAAPRNDTLAEPFPGQWFAGPADIQAQDSAVLSLPLESVYRDGRLKSRRELDRVLQILNLSLAYRGRTSDNLKLVLYGNASPEDEALIQKALKGASAKIDLLFVNTADVVWGAGGLPEALGVKLNAQGVRVTKTLGLIYSDGWESKIGAPREMAYVRTDNSSLSSVLVALALGPNGKKEDLPKPLSDLVQGTLEVAGRLVFVLFPNADPVEWDLFLDNLSRRTTQSSA